ncbi:putative phosphothreonine lyase domain-containing protein [Halobacteriaceae archaeon GCM10025711]
MDTAPTEIVEEGRYWHYAMEVIDGQKPTGDEYRTRNKYFSVHDVARPQNLTVDDLPSADSEAIRDLDEKALESEKVGGKWHVYGSAAMVNRLWPDVVADVDEQILWGAKAMTATGWEAHPGDDYMILVYTPNYFDKQDVDRVREHLRDEYGMTQELFYKPNVYSANGIQPDTAEEWGLSMAARYRA